MKTWDNPVDEATDMGWLAGFYEGEGSCGCYRKTNYSKTGKKYVYPNGALRVTISQKDETIIRWIQETVGYGSISRRLHNPSSFGGPLWNWYATANEALKFLMMIRPFLKIERRRVQLDTAVKLYTEAKA